jgi:ribosomal protein S27AE
MIDLTDKTYILQSLMELIRDENIRIVAQRLATSDEAHKLTKDVSTSIARQIQSPNVVTGDLVAPLSLFHRNLAAIKLPGDFQKVAADLQDTFSIILEPLSEHELETEINPCPSCGKEKAPAEHKPDSKTNIHCPSCGAGVALALIPEDELDPEPKQKHAAILARLEKIAYNLGQAGKHEAAYLVERTMHDLEATASDGAEMDQRRNPPAQYSRPEDTQLFQPVQPLQGVPKFQPTPPAQHPALHPAQPVGSNTQQMQPDAKLQQLWQTLTPQQKAQFNQMRQQKPTETLERLIEKIKQPKPQTK